MATAYQQIEHDQCESHMLAHCYMYTIVDMQRLGCNNNELITTHVVSSAGARLSNSSSLMDTPLALSWAASWHTGLSLLSVPSERLCSWAQCCFAAVRNRV